MTNVDLGRWLFGSSWTSHMAFLSPTTMELRYSGIKIQRSQCTMYIAWQFLSGPPNNLRYSKGPAWLGRISTVRSGSMQEWWALMVVCYSVSQVSDTRSATNRINKTYISPDKVWTNCIDGSLLFLHSLLVTDKRMGGGNNYHRF